MFNDRDFCARLMAAAVTISLGLANAAPVQAGTVKVRATAPHTVPGPGTINVLHSFAGTDGANPQGDLELGVTFAGKSLVPTLFGAAQFGGANGDGTLFSQETAGSGHFADFLTFAGRNGATPSAGLTGFIPNYTVNGPFIGVTTNGGAYGFGAVYTVSASGKAIIDYSFTGRGDGANPVGALVYSNGYFYGTTSAGAKGYGTIFKISLATAKLTTIHTFTNGVDGGTPLAGLTLRVTIPAANTAARNKALSGRAIDARLAPSNFVDPNLYGTTSNGGAAGGDGTIFSISPSGTLTTLYTFNDSTNPGATPAAELVSDFNGNLYGTTSAGGSAGLGEVFEYSAGQVAVLHDFGSDPVSGIATTGATPLAPLTILSNGNIYGTTSSGSANGLGNVFEITSNGFALKYEFSGPDGATPQAGLVDGLDGTLYSTTSAGGANGVGEIFNIAE